jgi:hypothetical protein
MIMVAVGVAVVTVGAAVFAVGAAVGAVGDTVVEGVGLAVELVSVELVSVVSSLCSNRLAVAVVLLSDEVLLVAVPKVGEAEGARVGASEGARVGAGLGVVSLTLA